MNESRSEPSSMAGPGKLTPRRGGTASPLKRMQDKWNANLSFFRQRHWGTSMVRIRLCRSDERDAIHGVVNRAAVAYRGVIPPDCWHEPYMGRADLDREIEAG